jgi:hypothetical protein
MMMGFLNDPSFSSTTVATGIGSLALRQVACRAKQARGGATDEVVETVDTEEIEDARDERERSEIMDSGLEKTDAELAIEGRREYGGNISRPGRTSTVQRLRPDFCAMAMAEHIDGTDGRRDPQALTAGVLEATVDGVSCGVGNGPMRGSAGGSMSSFGSRNLGSTVVGVGVLSCDIDSSCITRETCFVGVGVVGDPWP